MAEGGFLKSASSSSEELKGLAPLPPRKKSSGSQSPPEDVRDVGLFEALFGFQAFSGKLETAATMLFSVLATMAVQGEFHDAQLHPPGVTLTLRLSTTTVILLIFFVPVFKLICRLLPLAKLLFYLRAFLPYQRFIETLYKVKRLMIMSKGHERKLLPYWRVAAANINHILANIDYIEVHFPAMMAYIQVFGPHLGTVMPVMNKLGPQLDLMIPLMKDLEPYMNEFIPHLPDIIDELPYMLPHLKKLIPYFATIVPILPKLKPHMKKIGPLIEQFLPYMEIIMRNFHYILPHLHLFMLHIDKLLPTLPKAMIHLDGMAPHFDAMAPSLEKFVPLIDRVIDHLPSIIPRLGDTLLNADAVLSYLGWTVNTPLVGAMELHGTGSTVVKIGRALKSSGGGAIQKQRASVLEREIAAAMERRNMLEERLVVQGWIKKRSTSARINSLLGRSWKRKYITIDNCGCMSVYKDESKSGASLRFRMYLGGCTVVEQEVGKAFKLKSGESKESGRGYTHYFRIGRGEKTVEEYDMWVKHFRTWEGTKRDAAMERKMSIVSSGVVFKEEEGEEEDEEEVEEEVEEEDDDEDD